MATHSRKRVLIACYGEPEDRKKAELVAKALGKSTSAMLLDEIRSKYQKIFGSVRPDAVQNKP